MSLECEFTSGRHDAITDVPGIRVGHWTDRRAATGCTVILCETAQVAAVDARGGAPGTRETEVLNGANLVRTCHAVVLCGGSAFGLEAADGVMRYLSEKAVGFETVVRKVPIVTAGVLFDLAIGKATVTPTAESGYRAATKAKAGKVEQGSVGAGTGATAAKLLGMEHCIKGGVGTASVTGPRGLLAGAIVAANPSGIVLNPENGATVAGPRGEPGTFVALHEALERRTAEMDALAEHTTLVCVATNAAIDHHQAQRLSYQSHNGLARTILPAHTFGDGDIAFVLGMGQVEIQPYDMLTLGTMVTFAVERAVLNAINAAEGLHGIPSAAEWLKGDAG